MATTTGGQIDAVRLLYIVVVARAFEPFSADSLGFWRTRLRSPLVVCPGSSSDTISMFPLQESLTE